LNRKGKGLRDHDYDYEDDGPDSQTQLNVTAAGAKVLNRTRNELRNLDPENRNSIISDTRLRKRPPNASSQTKQQEPKSKTQQVELPANKRVRKRPANASLTKQQGPKSTSQPGSTIALLQRLPGCRIQCDRAHPNPLSFSAQLPIEVSEFRWNCLLGNTINTLAALGHLGHIMDSKVVSNLLQAFASSNIPLKISIDSVLYSLKHHGYSIAITK
jgi:hypothetical protein